MPGCTEVGPIDGIPSIGPSRGRSRPLDQSGSTATTAPAGSTTTVPTPPPRASTTSRRISGVPKFRRFTVSTTLSGRPREVGAPARWPARASTFSVVQSRVRSLSEGSEVESDESGSPPGRRRPRRRGRRVPTRRRAAGLGAARPARAASRPADRRRGRGGPPGSGRRWPARCAGHVPRHRVARRRAPGRVRRRRPRGPGRGPAYPQVGRSPRGDTTTERRSQSKVVTSRYSGSSPVRRPVSVVDVGTGPPVRSSSSMLSSPTT